MESILSSPTLYLFARLLIGGVFCLAGGSKLRESVTKRVAAVYQFALLPPLLTKLVGLFLPWVELTVGAGLLLGLGLPWVGWASLLLLVLFTGMITANLVGGRKAPCFCFGQGDSTPATWFTAARNLLLLLLGLLLVASQSRLLRLQDLFWGESLQLDELSLELLIRLSLLLALAPILFQIVEQFATVVGQGRRLRRRV